MLVQGSFETHYLIHPIQCLVNFEVIYRLSIMEKQQRKPLIFYLKLISFEKLFISNVDSKHLLLSFYMLRKLSVAVLVPVEHRFQCVTGSVLDNLLKCRLLGCFSRAFVSVCLREGLKIFSIKLLCDDVAGSWAPHFETHCLS